MDNVFKAHLTSGGLCSTEQCVYLVELRRGDEVWRYVGRTGTSNGTGVSSPYKRLAKHLAKVGNTQSCIWEAPTTPRISKDLLKDAEILFTALPMAHAKQLALSERWLRWKFGGRRSLNQQSPPSAEPDLDSQLKGRLQKVFGLGASE
jgi:hypothetical protein